MESAPLPPVIEKPSETVVWLLRVMMTPTVVLAVTEIASTATICASFAEFRFAEVSVRTIVSVFPPPLTVSLRTKP